MLDIFCRVPRVDGHRRRSPRSPALAGAVMHGTLGRLANARTCSRVRSWLRSALLIAVTTVGPRVAIAQRVTLTGFVRDSAGAPIPEADVSIPAAHLLTRTDNSGLFSLTRVSAGAVEVSVRRLGYVPRSLQLDINPTGSDTVAVTMVPQALELPGIVDRKSTRLNSSHLVISYAVFC